MGDENSSTWWFGVTLEMGVHCILFSIGVSGSGLAGVTPWSCELFPGLKVAR